MLSSSNNEVNILVEGDMDELVVTRLLAHVGLVLGRVRGKAGKDDLIAKLRKYNQSAQLGNKWLVVLDLDRETCAVAYRQHLLPEPAQSMMLRIAVRMIEAWLLADREHIARYLGVGLKNIPVDPDTLENPKQALIDIVRRKVNKRTQLYDDVVPRTSRRQQVGKGYYDRIREFVEHERHPWRPEVAAEHSESLRRCLHALEAWRT